MAFAKSDRQSNMRYILCRHRHFLSLLSTLFLVLQSAADEPDLSGFRLSFDGKVAEAPFTGGFFVMLSKEPIRDPPAGPNWFNPQPFFAKDVKIWKPGESMVLGSDSIAYPEPLSKLPAGVYYAQAVM